MSGPALATKSPESDTTEDAPPTSHVPPPATHQASTISANDSIAQTGPTMGEHCTTDRPLLSTNVQPSGSISKLGDTDTYISKPSDYPSTPSPLLLLLTGGTGVHSINNQLQADLYASRGYVVIVPDQFANDPAPSTNTITSPSSEQPSMFSIENIKLRAAETAKSFMIDMWLARQTAEKVLPRIHKVLEAAKDEYADCVAHSGGIYAAGYCFGAKYVLILAGAQADSVLHGQTTGDEEQGMVKKGPLIKAGAIAHATLVTREDVRGIKVPVSIVAVENDPLFPEEILDVGRKHLATTAVELEIKVYKGVPHGFAVVGEYAEGNIKGEQEKAFEQMVGWLKNHS